MKPLAIRMCRDEQGFVISAELTIVLTVAVLAMVVGLNGVASAINQELNDLSGAFGTLDQSYFYRGLRKSSHAAVAGAGYVDGGDFCDCTIMTRTVGKFHSGGGYGGSYGGSYGYSGTMVAPSPTVTAPSDPCATPCPNGAPCDGCDPATSNEPIPDPTPGKLVVPENPTENAT
jgi:hypothetical protein